MSGILLYTLQATLSEAWGTGTANPRRFMSLLAEALVASECCTYDPVCIESKGQAETV